MKRFPGMQLLRTSEKKFRVKKLSIHLFLRSRCCYFLQINDPRVRARAGQTFIQARSEKFAGEQNN